VTLQRRIFVTGLAALPVLARAQAGWPSWNGLLVEFMHAETTRYADVIRRANITLDS